MAKTDPILYKYRCFGNKYHKALLEKNILYFSAPEHFNDPFDCAIPIKILPRSADEFRALERDLIANDPDMAELIKSNGMSEDEYVEWRVTRILNDYETERKNLEEYTLNFTAGHGILSLTPHWDNILMWSHYADCHKGFCVGLNVTKVYGALQHYSLNDILNTRIIFEKVLYPEKEDYPDINYYSSEEEMTKMFLTKSNHWKYEDEVRFIIDKADEKIMVDDSAIEEVVFGLKASDKDIDDVVSLLQKKSSQPKLFKIEKVQNKFRVDRIPYLL